MCRRKVRVIPPGQSRDPEEVVAGPSGKNHTDNQEDDDDDSSENGIMQRLLFRRGEDANCTGGRDAYTRI